MKTKTAHGVRKMQILWMKVHNTAGTSTVPNPSPIIRPIWSISVHVIKHCFYRCIINQMRCFLFMRASFDCFVLIYNNYTFMFSHFGLNNKVIKTPVSRNVAFVHSNQSRFLTKCPLLNSESAFLRSARGNVLATPRHVLFSPLSFCNEQSWQDDQRLSSEPWYLV